MASRTKQYDKNRFRKVYPRFRGEPRPGLQVSGTVVLETVVVSFTEEDTKTITLVGPYTSVPSISVTPHGNLSSVNVFVSSAVLQSVPGGTGRGCLVTIKASASFTGDVHVQAMLTS
mgnify:CR=1 FL=1|tara:strand:+ start:367 stop:717 length:351 start_codon:yes stop_codon:yes gene_type:complete